VHSGDDPAKRHAPAPGPQRLTQSRSWRGRACLRPRGMAPTSKRAPNPAACEPSSWRPLTSTGRGSVAPRPKAPSGRPIGCRRSSTRRFAGADTRTAWSPIGPVPVPHIPGRGQGAGRGSACRCGRSRPGTSRRRLCAQRAADVADPSAPRRHSPGGRIHTRHMTRSHWPPGDRPAHHHCRALQRRRTRPRRARAPRPHTRAANSDQAPAERYCRAGMVAPLSPDDSLSPLRPCGLSLTSGEDCLPAARCATVCRRFLGRGVGAACGAPRRGGSVPRVDDRRHSGRSARAGHWSARVASEAT